MNTPRKLFFGLMVLLVLAIALTSMRYLDFNIRDLLQDKSEIISSSIYRTGFYGHVILGIIALLAGPSQFIPSIRSRRVNIHRNIGRVYVIACILSGLCGLYIAQYASTGLIARLGFSGLAISWLITTSMAYAAIKRHEVMIHQIWMIRSYALTFAAVTLRLYLGPSLAFGAPFEVAYPIISWACWIPNIIVAELFFVRPLRTAKTLA